MFYKAHPDRYINNIYFDTVNLDNNWDNVAGNSKRMKIRVRWYNDLFSNISNPILEFKLKNNFFNGFWSLWYRLVAQFIRFP